MFSINNTKTFKDSVHGYIEVPRCFVDNLMDNEYFQRLRNIEQTGMRVLYPNAKHDRFCHSLGVFYLGSRAVDVLLENFSKDQYWNIESDNQSVLYWAKNKVLFLIACLLHDIGHAPFSHALESHMLHNSKPEISTTKRKKGITDNNVNYVTKHLQEIILKSEKEYMKLKYGEDIENTEMDISKVAPHEQLGALLIFNDFFKNQIIKIFDVLHDDGFPRPTGDGLLYSEYYQDKIVIDKINLDNKESCIVFNDDICFIARMIMGLKYDDWRPERQIRNCFIELLNGTNFDVDKLDYIVRDTQMSGINNISVDVDRLLNSLCIITKTKHFNKKDLLKNMCNQLTILHIQNSDKNNTLKIDGTFQGTLIIKKNTEVKIDKGSTIESFTNLSSGEAQIKYKTAQIATFNDAAIVKQDSELLVSDISSEDESKKITTLRGKGGKQVFTTSIVNATVLECFNFIANEDIRLKIRENCIITIQGPFHSERSVKLFNVKEMRGDISEIEILADTFKRDFTNTKVPCQMGYNTFSIGFKKQAINVIANVIDARNYLYLWIYAHHKVIYYANFLIPVLVKELLPVKTVSQFPDRSLSFENIKWIDDAYIWTSVKNIYYTKKLKNTSKDKELKVLLNELFTRKYKKSLYKSLAEYDLFFEKYDQKTKQMLQDYINDHIICTSSTRPYIESTEKKRKKNFLVGYFKSDQLKKINAKLCSKIQEYYDEIPDFYTDFKLTEMVYVSADYKMKQLETVKTFIDMKDDIIPISQMPLLDSQMNKTTPDGINTYFYLYYQTQNTNEKGSKEIEFVKETIKDYFDDIVENFKK